MCSALKLQAFQEKELIWRCHARDSTLSQYHMYENLSMWKQGISEHKQTSYITADCWITAMPLSFAVYSLLSALGQRMEGAAFTDLTAEPWRGRGLP